MSFRILVVEPLIWDHDLAISKAGVIEVSMEQRRNEGAWKRETPEKTRRIVWHDSHMRKSDVWPPSFLGWARGNCYCSSEQFPSKLACDGERVDSGGAEGSEGRIEELEIQTDAAEAFKRSAKSTFISDADWEQIATSVDITMRQDPARLPLRQTGFNTQPGHSRIFACGNRAGRYRWSGGFLEDLPFPPSFHSRAAPYSPESPSSPLKLSLLRAAQISSLVYLTFLKIWRIVLRIPNIVIEHQRLLRVSHLQQCSHQHRDPRQQCPYFDACTGVKPLRLAAMSDDVKMTSKMAVGAAGGLIESGDLSGVAALPPYQLEKTTGLEDAQEYSGTRTLGAARHLEKCLRRCPTTL
ncbi:hypothetical protein PR048_009901 [Dryococelus australis]|uniref:Uncharacterized protein n=1 Tax=Dryococelus australis TaxID=614101 RepID=A0ABQ9I330_9NEOP|nr:hypothetical protein PR048_009901 [Dryococelus australis]